MASLAGDAAWAWGHDAVSDVLVDCASDPIPEFKPTEVDEALGEVLANGEHVSPSYVYLKVVRECLRRHWDLAPVSHPQPLGSSR
jgi:hypothetical protein